MRGLKSSKFRLEAQDRQGPEGLSIDGKGHVERPHGGGPVQRRDKIQNPMRHVVGFVHDAQPTDDAADENGNGKEVRF